MKLARKTARRDRASRFLGFGPYGFYKRDTGASSTNGMSSQSALLQSSFEAIAERGHPGRVERPRARVPTRPSAARSSTPLFIWVGSPGAGATSSTSLRARASKKAKSRVSVAHAARRSSSACRIENLVFQCPRCRALNESPALRDQTDSIALLAIRPRGGFLSMRRTTPGGFRLPPS